MAQLPLNTGIPRFKQNEERMDRFTNGSDNQTFTTSGGVEVPTIRKFLKDKDAEIDSNVEQMFEEAATGLVASVTAEADRSRDEADRSEAARDVAAGYASDAVSQGNVPIYATVMGMPALEIPPGINAIRVNGRDSAADGGGGLYVDEDNGSADTFTTADGRTWHRVADIGVSRFSDKALEMWRFVKTKYRKRFHKNLPVRGPNYNAILAADGLSFLIPQAWCVDWTDGLMFINCSGDIAGGHLWVRVHNFWTGEYVRTFSVPLTPPQSFSEGIVVRRVGGSRKLEIQTAVNTISRFDINVLPSEMGSVGVAEFSRSVGLHSQFDNRNGLYIVQQLGPDVGVQNRRNIFALYNDDLTSRKGMLVLSNSDAGPWTDSALADYVPKIQSMQIGDGFFFASCGGFHQRGSTAVPYSYQGIKLFNSDGSLLDENLIDPETMAQIIEASGYVCDKVEYEGSVVSPDGRIFSLCLAVGNNSAAASSQGIIIFEEFAQGDNCVDFASAARVYPKVDISRISSGIWPRSPGGAIHNPWTGAGLTTWEQICDMMVAMSVPRLAYYTSATTTVTGISGEVIPTGCLVEMINHDNQSWTVNIDGYGFKRLYRIFGTAGSRSVLKRSIPVNGQRGVTAAEVQAIGGLSLSIADGNYYDVATQTADGVLRIDPTNSTIGNVIKIKRRGGAFNLVIQNGAGTTITTLTANQTAELMMGSTQYYLWQ